MNFTKLTVDDVDTVRFYSRYNRSRTCDLSYGCIVMWRDYFSIESCVEDNIFYSMLHDTDGRVYFNLPLCEETLLPDALTRVREYCRERGLTCRFCTVPEEYMPLFGEVFGEVSAREHRDYSDYIYRTDDIVNLTGKKYSGQRNHISRFKRSYDDWSFEVINDSNIEAVRAFMADFAVRYKKETASADEDLRITMDVLDNFDRYCLLGGVLRVGARVVGFSVGEIVGDTLVVHIEKADRDYDGCYQMLTNQFARMFSDGTVFINREDDMGDEGLRRAKLAYHPVRLLSKYTVTVNM